MHRKEFASSQGTPPFTLSHPLGFEISPNLKKKQVVETGKANERDMKTGYVWCDLPKANIAGTAILIQLCFHHGRLCSLHVCPVDENLYGISWDDWTREKEELRVKHTAEWFARLGFPVGKYPWGVIWASFDERGGWGGGGVSYKSK